jgi:hypothetical protein
MDIRRVGNSDIQLKNARLSPPIASSQRNRQRTETTPNSDWATITPLTVARTVPTKAFGLPIFTEEHFNVKGRWAACDHSLQYRQFVIIRFATAPIGTIEYQALSLYVSK